MRPVSNRFSDQRPRIQSAAIHSTGPAALGGNNSRQPFIRSSPSALLFCDLLEKLFDEVRHRHGIQFAFL